MEKTQVLDLIQREVVDVEFVKINGDIRLLTCTLDPKLLPQQKPVTMEQQDKQPEDENPDHCAVFDTINQGWRSFRWSSVITVNGELYLN